ncbi:hypothetical protein D3C87_1155620 [compost metagenome]
MTTSDPMTVEQLAQAMSGMSFAMGSAIRAIIKTHPDQQALQQSLEDEFQQALSHVTASPMADRTLESMHLFWDSLRPIP